ncbi:MAG TPA: type VI secretion system baseplate subunit TssG [Noviherbaspirillum sp.]|uniref:type VI secretion system baseplate subunit TssG n=1 Tax=Noviherbaspirillum sp. TaxID=1926288 RepID=UPI002B47F687|nr:type VI secretion system baseplate subunit TssG [Noviherbaspirillum sp.]HJV85036.1 type VI secretion system baseplate subunit TssG [Noviherbaspirillum sp.]
MPREKRRRHTSLIQSLREEPYRFEFFQAVRLLLMLHRAQSGKPDAHLLGQIIRFRSSAALAFPPSEIESIDFDWPETHAGDSDGDSCLPCRDTHAGIFKPVTITPAFIGLTGPLGVLPRHYTQYVADREIHHRDVAARAFFDIFSSRSIALFYEAWQKYRPHLHYEAEGKTGFLPLVASLAGLGFAGVRDRLKEDGSGISDESLAFYASALRQRPRSATWFSRVVSDYFRVTCNIDQFIGQWFELPAHELTRLGAANCDLGRTTFCGGRIWDRQTKLRLTLGPMQRKQFDDFLPGGAAQMNLARLLRLMLGITFDCEVRLVLDKRDVTPARLETRQDGTRLGWNSWFTKHGTRSDSRDVAYLIKVSDHV